MNQRQLEPRIAGESDRSALLAFFGRLSSSTIQARYLSSWTCLDEDFAVREVERLLASDSNHVVLVAADDTGIHGIAEFVAQHGGHSAELALVVEDAFQSRGIGPVLYRQLEE